MKKTIFMALIILVSATFTATAGDKKKKKSKKELKKELAMRNAPVSLTSGNDSTSYVAGLAATLGLIDYLQQSMDLDTAFMADFKQGFYDAMERGTDPKYVAYNAGVQIFSQVQKQIFPRDAQFFESTPDSLNQQLYYRGFVDGAMGDSTVMKTEAATEFMAERREAVEKKKNEAYIAENTSWLAENAKKEGVQTTASGLQYKIITEGSGKVATLGDNVTVKYEGRMIDGTVFDSSYKRNPDTTSFRPEQVIKGWTEALCMMPEGSKWELYIPQELGYGQRKAGQIKPFSTLIFTVEVVKVETKK